MARLTQNGIYVLTPMNRATLNYAKSTMSCTLGSIIKIKFHGTDTNTDTDTDFRDAPIA